MVNVRYLLAAVALVLSTLPAEPSEPPPLPVDGILIPYRSGTLPGAGEDPTAKVYVPYPKFLELQKLADPRRPEEAKPPADVFIGGAEYSLRLEADRYHLAGSLIVQLLTDRWTAVPLPFDRAGIVRLRVDGADAAAGQGEKGPFIGLKGMGPKKIDVELTGTVGSAGGSWSIDTALLSGAASWLRAELPAGAEVVAARGIARIEKGPAATAVTVDLGSSGRVALAWSFPKIEGQTGSQVESVSYSRVDLTLYGFAIKRREAIRVTGRPVDRVEYRIAGGFQVTEVTGADLSEWSVVKGDPPAGDRLQVFFSKPIHASELLIRGRALATGRAPLPTLVLSGAVKQESYVGLRHAPSRRFVPDALSGMRRSTIDDVRRVFAVPASEMPDKIHHAYGSAEGELLEGIAPAAEWAVETHATALVRADRVIFSVQSRYKGSGPGPVRHEAALPAGWSVRSVQSPALRTWEVVTMAGGARLVVHFKGRAAEGTQVLWTAETSFAALPDPLGIPVSRAISADPAGLREEWTWILAADESLDLAAGGDPGRWSPIALHLVPKSVELPSDASYRFAYRIARLDAAPAALGLRASRRSSQLGAAAVLFARVSEDEIQVNARIGFRVRFAGRDRFRLRLPAGAELLVVETRNQQSRQARPGPDGTEVEIVLQSPVTGEHEIGVTYRIPRQAGAQPVLLPITLFDGAAPLAEVDWYVGIVQTGITTISAAAAPGLGRVEAESLPVLPEGVSAQSLQPTFRAHQLAWSLTLAEQEIQTEPGLAAVIELAEISTTVGVDGTARTQALLILQNRSLQFLDVELPPGASLWGVSINGKPTAVGEGNPAAAGTAPAAARLLRIPVEHVGSASLSLEVALLYEEARLDLPSLRGRAALAAPRVRGVQIVETTWEVRFPDGYTLALGGGNLREVPASSGYAKRVRHLLNQLGKIQKAASGSDSRRVREQAEREMARLEQTLGDSIAELAGSNRSDAEQNVAERLGQADVAEQWDENDRLLKESKDANDGLRAQRQEREKAQKEKKEAAAPSQREQSFQDAANYQKRAWRAGKQVQTKQSAEPQSQSLAPPEGPKGPEGPADPAQVGNQPGEPSAYFGLQGLRFTPAGVDHDVAAAAPIDAKGGLKPLPPAAGAGAAPGLEVPPAGKEGEGYTFFRTGGDAQLEIAFTRRDTLPRATALAALILFPAAFVVLRLRRKRTAGAAAR